MRAMGHLVQHTPVGHWYCSAMLRWVLPTVSVSALLYCDCHCSRDSWNGPAAGR